MASVNKVILVGNLGKEPEVRYMPDGAQVTNITLATTDTWKDKNSGEKKEATEWHRVVFFRKLAEIAGQYLKKGSQIYLEGSLKTRKWQDKDGQDRYTTEILADSMQMLGRRTEGGSQAPAQGQAAQGQPAASNLASNLASNSASNPASGGIYSNLEDDIPFDRLGRGLACHVL